MTNRTSCIVVCVLIIAVLLFLIIEGTQTKKQDMEVALRQGLITRYVSAINQSPVEIPTNVMSAVIREDLALPGEKRHLLPSFVEHGMVYSSEKPVAVGSDDVIWSVKLDSKYLCIKGNEDSGLLSQSEFDNWKHMRN